MVLLTHSDITVRSSKSSELDPTSKLTPTDATKPNANESILLRKDFMLFKLMLPYLGSFI